MVISFEFVWQGEGAVWIGWEVDKASDGIQVERAVDVGERLTALVTIFVDEFGSEFGGVNGEQNQVGLSSIELIGGQQHLIYRRAMNKPFAIQ